MSTDSLLNNARNFLLSSVVLTTLVFASVRTAQAESGVLDPSFSIDGVMSQSVDYQRSNITEHANAMISDTSHRLVVIGSNNRQINGYWGSAFVARFNADGQLDTTFAEHGSLQLPYGYVLSDVKIDSSERIVISGYVFNQTNDNCFETQTLIVRLTSDGQLDSDFADSGMLKTHQTECETFFAETTAGTSLLVDAHDGIITNSLLNSGSGFESIVVSDMSATV